MVEHMQERVALAKALSCTMAEQKSGDLRENTAVLSLFAAIECDAPSCEGCPQLTQMEKGDLDLVLR